MASEVNIRIRSQFDGQGIKQAQNELRNLQRSLQGIGKQMGSAFKQSLDTRAIRDAANSMKQLEQSGSKAATGFKALSNAARDASQRANQLSQSTKQVGQSSTQASTGMTKLSTATKKAVSDAVKMGTSVKDMSRETTQGMTAMNRMFDQQAQARQKMIQANQQYQNSVNQLKSAEQGLSAIMRQTTTSSSQREAAINKYRTALASAAAAEKNATASLKAYEAATGSSAKGLGLLASAAEKARGVLSQMGSATVIDEKQAAMIEKAEAALSAYETASRNFGQHSQEAATAQNQLSQAMSDVAQASKSAEQGITAVKVAVEQQRAAAQQAAQAQKQAAQQAAAAAKADAAAHQQAVAAARQVVAVANQVVSAFRNMANAAIAAAKAVGSTLVSALRNAASAMGTVASGASRFASMIKNLEATGKAATNFGRDFSNGMNQASDSFDKLDKTAAGWSAMMVGRQAQRSGEQVLGGLGNMLGGYLDYEKEMVLTSIVSGATPQIIDEVVRGIQQGEYGTPVTIYDQATLARGLGEFTKAAGFNITEDNAQSIVDTFLPIVQTAHYTGAQLDPLITGVLNAAMEFGVDVRDMDIAPDAIKEVSALFGYLANVSTMDVGDISEFFKMVGPLSNVLSPHDGLDAMRDVMSFAFMASEMGLRGGNPGRGLGQLLQSLLDPTKPMNESSMEFWGKPVQDVFFDENKRLKGGIEGLFKPFLGMNEADWVTAQAELFTNNASRALIPLIEQARNSPEKWQMIQDLLASGGPAVDMLDDAFAQSSNTITAALADAKNAWNDLIASIVGSVSGELKGVFKTVASAVREVADVIKDFPELGQLFVGIAGGVGALLTASGALITMAGAALLAQRYLLMTGSALSVLGSVAGAIPAVLGMGIPLLAAVGAAAVALGVAWESNFLGMRDAVQGFLSDPEGGLADISEKMKPGIDAFLDFSRKGIAAFKQFVSGILLGVGPTNDLGAALKAVFGGLIGGFVYESLLKFGDALSVVRDRIGDLVSGIGSRLPTVLRGVGASLQMFFEKVLFGIHQTKLNEAIIDLGDMFGVNLVQKIAQGATLVRNAIGSFGTIMRDAWNQITADGGIGSNIVANFQSLWEQVKNAVSLDQALDFGRGLAEGIGQGFAGAIGGALRVAELVSQALAGLPGILGQAGQAIQDFANRFLDLEITVEGVGKAIGTVIGAYLGGRLVSAILPFGSALASVAAQAVAFGASIVAVGARLASVALNIAAMVAQFVIGAGIMVANTGATLALAAAKGVLAAASTAAAAGMMALTVALSAVGVVLGVVGVAFGALALAVPALAVGFGIAMVASEEFRAKIAALAAAIGPDIFDAIRNAVEWVVEAMNGLVDAVMELHANGSLQMWGSMAMATLDKVAGAAQKVADILSFISGISQANLPGSLAELEYKTLDETKKRNIDRELWHRTAENQGLAGTGFWGDPIKPFYEYDDETLIKNSDVFRDEGFTPAGMEWKGDTLSKIPGFTGHQDYLNIRNAHLGIEAQEQGTETGESFVEGLTQGIIDSVRNWAGTEKLNEAVSDFLGVGIDTSKWGIEEWSKLAQIPGAESLLAQFSARETKAAGIEDFKQHLEDIGLLASGWENVLSLGVELDMSSVKAMEGAATVAGLGAGREMSEAFAEAFNEGMAGLVDLNLKQLLQAMDGGLDGTNIVEGLAGFQDAIAKALGDETTWQTPFEVLADVAGVKGAETGAEAGEKFSDLLGKNFHEAIKNNPGIERAVNDTGLDIAALLEQLPTFIHDSQFVPLAQAALLDGLMQLPDGVYSNLDLLGSEYNGIGLEWDKLVEFAISNAQAGRDWSISDYLMEALQISREEADSLVSNAGVEGFGSAIFEGLEEAVYSNMGDIAALTRETWGDINKHLVEGTENTMAMSEAEWMELPAIVRAALSNSGHEVVLGTQGWSDAIKSAISGDVVPAIGEGFEIGISEIDATGFIHTTLIDPISGLEIPLPAVNADAFISSIQTAKTEAINALTSDLYSGADSVEEAYFLNDYVDGIISQESSPFDSVIQEAQALKEELSSSVSTGISEGIGDATMDFGPITDGIKQSVSTGIAEGVTEGVAQVTAGGEGGSPALVESVVGTSEELAEAGRDAATQTATGFKEQIETETSGDGLIPQSAIVGDGSAAKTAGESYATSFVTGFTEYISANLSTAISEAMTGGEGGGESAEGGGGAFYTQGQDAATQFVKGYQDTLASDMQSALTSAMSGQGYNTSRGLNEDGEPSGGRATMPTFGESNLGQQFTTQGQEAAKAFVTAYQDHLATAMPAALESAMNGGGTTGDVSGPTEGHGGNAGAGGTQTGGTYSTQGQAAAEQFATAFQLHLATVLPTALTSAFGGGEGGGADFSSIGTAIFESVAAGLAEADTSTIGAALVTKIDEGVTANISTLTTTGQTLVDTIVTAGVAHAVTGMLIGAEIPFHAGEGVGLATAVLVAAIQAMVDVGVQAGVGAAPAATAIGEGMATHAGTGVGAATGTVTAAIQAMVDAGVQAGVSAAAAASAIGEAMATAAGGGVGQGTGTLVSALQAMVDVGIQAGIGAAAGAAAIGIAIAEGAAAGVGQGTGTLVAAVQAMVDVALEAGQNRIDSQSPSKVWRDEIGLPMVQGVAGGILDNVDLAKDAARTMADETTDAAAEGMASGVNTIKEGIQAQVSAIKDSITNLPVLNNIKDQTKAQVAAIKENIKKLPVLQKYGFGQGGSTGGGQQSAAPTTGGGDTATPTGNTGTSGDTGDTGFRDLGQKWGMDHGGGVAEGIRSQIPNVQGAAQELVNSANDAGKNAAGAAGDACSALTNSNIGQPLGCGVATGIEERLPQVNESMSNLVGEAQMAGETAAGITGSGSREGGHTSQLTKDAIGGPLGTGVADGIDESAPLAEDAMTGTVDGAVEAGKDSAGVGGEAGDGASSLTAEEIGKPLTTGIAEGITAFRDAVSDALRGVIDGGVAAGAAAAEGAGEEVVEPMGEGITTGVNNLASKIHDAIRALVEKIRSEVNAAVGELQRLGAAAQDVAVSGGSAPAGDTSGTSPSTDSTAPKSGGGTRPLPSLPDNGPSKADTAVNKYNPLVDNYAGNQSGGSSTSTNTGGGTRTTDTSRRSEINDAYGKYRDTIKEHRKQYKEANQVLTKSMNKATRRLNKSTYSVFEMVRQINKRYDLIEGGFIRDNKTAELFSLHRGEKAGQRNKQLLENLGMSKSDVSNADIAASFQRDDNDTGGHHNTQVELAKSQANMTASEIRAQLGPSVDRVTEQVKASMKDARIELNTTLKEIRGRAGGKSGSLTSVNNNLVSLIGPKGPLSAIFKKLGSTLKVKITNKGGGNTKAPTTTTDEGTTTTDSPPPRDTTPLNPIATGLKTQSVTNAPPPQAQPQAAPSSMSLDDDFGSNDFGSSSFVNMNPSMGISPFATSGDTSVLASLHEELQESVDGLNAGPSELVTVTMTGDIHIHKEADVDAVVKRLEYLLGHKVSLINRGMENIRT